MFDATNEVSSIFVALGVTISAAVDFVPGCAPLEVVPDSAHEALRNFSDGYDAVPTHLEDRAGFEDPRKSHSRTENPVQCP